MKNYHHIYIITILAVTGLLSQTAAPAENSSVKWYTIQEAEKLIKKESTSTFY